MCVCALWHSTMISAVLSNALSYSKRVAVLCMNNVHALLMELTNDGGGHSMNALLGSD